VGQLSPTHIPDRRTHDLPTSPAIVPVPLSSRVADGLQPVVQTTTFKSGQHKLTIAMIDRLEKEVDMLERHLQVLRMVIENEPIGIVKMSNETGYPHHKVRYSLRVLEEENLIEPSSQGAITTEDTHEFVDDLDGKLDQITEKLDEMKIDEFAEVEN
jgi:predicted transcriptional regulator